MIRGQGVKGSDKDVAGMPPKGKGQGQLPVAKPLPEQQGNGPVLVSLWYPGELAKQLDIDLVPSVLDVFKGQSPFHFT